MCVAAACTSVAADVWPVVLSVHTLTTKSTCCPHLTLLLCVCCHRLAEPEAAAVAGAAVRASAAGQAARRQ